MRMMAQAPEHELKPQWAWSCSRSRFVGAGVTPYFGIYVGKHRQGTRLNIKENWKKNDENGFEEIRIFKKYFVKEESRIFNVFI